MPQYRVRPGRTFGWKDDVGPGEVVELTEAEAAGFLDKLKLIEEEDAPAAAPAPAEDKRRKG